MLISKLISSAVRLWLKSQVSQVNNLELKIVAKNQQLLHGYIPQVLVNASNVIYQKLYISKLEIKGTNIQFNLPQVLKRKPLQILEPIVIEINALFSATDLQSSLSSPLLNAGLSELGSNFLPLEIGQTLKNNSNYQWNWLFLLESGISFQGNFYDLIADYSSIEITTKIAPYQDNSLQLFSSKIISDSQFVTKTAESLIWNLGNQITINKLEITPENLLFQGTIMVFPE